MKQNRQEQTCSRNNKYSIPYKGITVNKETAARIKDIKPEMIKAVKSILIALSRYIFVLSGRKAFKMCFLSI